VAVSSKRSERRATEERQPDPDLPIRADRQPPAAAPGGGPPAPPGEPGQPYTGRDDHSVGIVFDMTKAAVELQFRIAERFDSKIKGYFGFAATVFAVAQAIVLKNDVHSNLGSKQGTVAGLAIASAVLLVIALFTAIWALAPQDEKDVSEDNLRSLARQAYEGDRSAGARGVNLLIGQLNRRKETNAERHRRMVVLMWVAGAGAFIAFLEVALAVEAVT